MRRRDFLRHAALATGSIALPAIAGEARQEKLERRNERPGMKYARLGRTNLMVSRITHGGQHTTPDRIPLLARLFEGGVNLFDASQIYGGGRCETAYGEFFSGGGRRDKVFICTKQVLVREMRAGQRVRQRSAQLMDQALRKLRTDHVDILMLHGVRSLAEFVDNEEWLAAAQNFKKQGKARFIGISEHQKPAEVLRKAVEVGIYDVAMVAFSATSGWWGGLARADLKTIRPALEAARKADLGVIAIKAAFRADEIAAKIKDPRFKKKGYSIHQLCYRYVLDVPPVATVVCGMTNMTHVEQNLKVPSIEFAAADREALERWAASSRTCGFCGACQEACPHGILTQDILRFHGYFLHGHRAEARAAYAALPRRRTAIACRDCGTCRAVCPNGVDIPRRLWEAHRVLSV